MATQEQDTLTPTARLILWRHILLPSGDVSEGAWLDARAQGRVVGSCPCGGNLVPGPPYVTGQTTWYPAECPNCTRSTAGHGPQPKPKPRKGGGE